MLQITANIMNDCLKNDIYKAQYYFQQSGMTDIQCVFEGMAGKGSIYISNFKAAQDMTLLQSKGIKAILSIARSGLLHHSKEDIPLYLYIPAEDNEGYEMHRHFNQTFEFIEQARRDTNVLVHCMVGISRSVTIVMAYLLKKYKSSLSQVIAMLQRKRKKINPNKGFIEQLKKYAQEQGLKCDFEGVEVPAVRESSVGSNRQRHFSASADRKQKQSYLLNNPLAIYDKDMKDHVKYCEKTAATNSDSKDVKLIVQKQKKDWIQKIQKIAQNMTQKLQMTDPCLRHQISSLKKQPQSRKMGSIEDKINRVRQKIKKEQIPIVFSKRSSSSANQYKELLNKENSLAKFEVFNEQENSKHKLINYIQLENNEISQLLQRQKADCRNIGRENNLIKKELLGQYDMEEDALFRRNNIDKTNKGTRRGKF